MTERIDFALEPGVVLFAVLFFVLVNVLLAAVLYPYFRSSSSSGGEAGAQPAAETDEFLEPESTSDEQLEERVDEFLEDIEKERAG